MVKLTLRVLVVPALALLLGAAVWAALPPVHSVVFADMGQTVVVKGRQMRTVADAAARAGITLNPTDRLVPAPDTPLPEERLSVAVLRAWPVRLQDGSSTHLQYTVARTVGDALREWQIPLGPLDRVQPPPPTPLAPDVTIKLTRVARLVETQVAEVPFDTVRRDDQSLAEGQVKEVQPGVPGRKEVVFQTTVVNGIVTTKDVVSEKILQPPQPRLLAYGTAGLVARGGQNLRYSRSLEMTATAYTPGPESNPDGNGLTYTGVPARRGIVAVDPRVIPLGTRLYIEGYGTALAADIGGAIKGNRIDLCVDTVAEADEFGIRKVKVYVLAD